MTRNPKLNRAWGLMGALTVFVAGTAGMTVSSLEGLNYAWAAAFACFVALAIVMMRSLRSTIEGIESEEDAHRPAAEWDVAAHRRFIRGLVTEAFRREKAQQRRAAAVRRDRGKFGVRLHGSESTIPMPVVSEVPPAA